MELALAAVAITLSVFAVAFELLFYNWQTNQGARITEIVNGFAKEMHGVLGEIKGLTTATLGELQEQFKWLLQARVGQERANLAGDVAERLQSLENAFADVASKAAAGPDGRLTSDIEDLKERVASLSSELSASAKKDAAVAEVPSRAPARRGSLVIEPRQVAPGGSVRLRFFGGSSLLARTTCLVDTPNDGTFTAEFGTVSSAAVSLQPPVLVFPQDFEGASTEAAGVYDVAVYQSSALDVLAAFGGGQTLLCTGSFVVENGPQP